MKNLFFLFVLISKVSFGMESFLNQESAFVKNNVNDFINNIKNNKKISEHSVKEYEKEIEEALKNNFNGFVDAINKQYIPDFFSAVVESDAIKRLFDHTTKEGKKRCLELIKILSNKEFSEKSIEVIVNNFTCDQLQGFDYNEKGCYNVSVSFDSVLSIKKSNFNRNTSGNWVFPVKTEFNLYDLLKKEINEEIKNNNELEKESEEHYQEEFKNCEEKSQLDEESDQESDQGSEAEIMLRNKEEIDDDFSKGEEESKKSIWSRFFGYITGFFKS